MQVAVAAGGGGHGDMCQRVVRRVPTECSTPRRRMAPAYAADVSLGSVGHASVTLGDRALRAGATRRRIVRTAGAARHGGLAPRGGCVWWCRDAAQVARSSSPFDCSQRRPGVAISDEAIPSGRCPPWHRSRREPIRALSSSGSTPVLTVTHGSRGSRCGGTTVRRPGPPRPRRACRSRSGRGGGTPSRRRRARRTRMT